MHQLYMNHLYLFIHYLFTLYITIKNYDEHKYTGRNRVDKISVFKAQIPDLFIIYVIDKSIQSAVIVFTFQIYNFDTCQSKT